jgi:hypothetical protein
MSQRDLPISGSETVSDCFRHMACLGSAQALNAECDVFASAADLGNDIEYIPLDGACSKKCVLRRSPTALGGPAPSIRGR